MPINVIVVDDHDIVVTGITKLLSDVDGISVIGTASTGEAAIQLSKKLSKEKQPHVILMDMRMPGIGGLEAIRKILCNDSKVKIIVLTTCVEDPYPTQSLKAGAVGFLSKDVSLEELVLAIRTVSTGKKYISSDMVQELAMKSVKKIKSPMDKLSARELSVMLMTITGKEADVMADLLCLSPKTINGYRHKVFKKLGVGSDVELVHFAVKHGLCKEN